MPETLSVPTPQEVRIKPSMKAETLFARYSHPANMPHGGEIAERHASERNILKEHHREAKQQVREETQEKLSVERMISEAQKMLYEALGIDPRLEANSLLGKFTKGGIDAMIMENIDLVKDIIEHGVGTVVEGIKSLFSLEGIERMLQETGKSLGDLVSGDAYVTGKTFGSVGFGAIGMVRGALKSEMKHVLKENSVVRGVNALAKKENPVPPAICDIGRWSFDVPGFLPADWLQAIKNLSGHLDYKELVGNFRWIEEFTKTIEKISNYILNNRSKILPEIAEDMFDAIKDLRKNVSKILAWWDFDIVDIQPLKTALEKDFNKGLRSLKPQVFQTTK